MKVLIQWSTTSASDWIEVDVHEPGAVDALAAQARELPNGREVLDHRPGWISAVNCQGIIFDGYDHIAIEPLPLDGVQITGWNDDPEDSGDWRLATRWELYPPAPDPAIGDRINTVQKRTMFGSSDVVARGKERGLPVRPWDEFRAPEPKPGVAVLHGIWLDKDLFQRHINARSLRGWREWING